MQWCVKKGKDLFAVKSLNLCTLGISWFNVWYWKLWVQNIKAIWDKLDKPITLNLVSKKLCKFVLFKYVFCFTIWFLVWKLLIIKVVKLIFGHPVCKTLIFAFKVPNKKDLTKCDLRWKYTSNESRLTLHGKISYKNESTRSESLTGGNWQKWKRVFLACLP